MKSPFNIHPPKNWQDFETLCLKLWGEIWNIPHEIDFNSDNAQGQHGVDIYGPVNGGKDYNGIQCKNKKLNLIDGSPNRISIKDIQEEIEKAKLFKPDLNKLVIATSLPKDQKIEEYVRTQSLQNVELGLFTIQICFWDFFERKLSEFPNVYNWYVKNEDFHQVKSISVLFPNGQNEISCFPKFQKTIKKYRIKKEMDSGADDLDLSLSFNELLEKYKLDLNTSKPGFKKFNDMFAKIDMSRNPLMPKIKWEQYCWLKLQITNTGAAVIEDYKIELEFEGDFIRVGAEKGHFIYNPKYVNTVREYSNSDDSLIILPKNRTLVQADYFTTGNFYIKPKIGEGSVIKMNWKIISRDFTDSGFLTIIIEPKFHQIVTIENTDSTLDEKDEVSYQVIERTGVQQIGYVDYYDKESDYNFE
ncbi:hypothetical protein LIV57_09780 [Chryseobacterium sp. X308]|uniref:hypothetical protein n=1 Tax=Chryseobacterium sp. X308 TaxID=2884873 RepID=UPI001D13B088|nr:hypothetical protein [Chryseobacterium sp. X308]MCC3215549.1 hypothetical protein [Chryseobacterium sp. X308]